MGDPSVEGGENDLLRKLHIYITTGALPESETDGGQQQAAVTTATVRHGRITVWIEGRGHKLKKAGPWIQNDGKPRVP